MSVYVGFQLTQVIGLEEGGGELPATSSVVGDYTGRTWRTTVKSPQCNAGRDTVSRNQGKVEPAPHLAYSEFGREMIASDQLIARRIRET